MTLAQVTGADQAADTTGTDTRFGWWLLTLPDGSLLLKEVKANADIPAGAKGTWLGPEQSITSLISSSGAQLGESINDAPGVTANQGATLIGELDHGIGVLAGQTEYILIGPDGGDASSPTVTSNAPTGTTSEADSAGINLPSVSLPSFLSVLGNIGFWKGIGLVLGGVLILWIAARELLKL